MEAMKLELGIHDSMFKLDYKVNSYLGTDCWVTYLLRLVFENEIEIDDEMDEAPLLRGNIVCWPTILC